MVIGPMRLPITGVLGVHVYATVTLAMQPTSSVGLQESVVLGGGLYETVTALVWTPSETAASAAQALIDQCGFVGSSTGMSSVQDVLDVVTWLTAATRAPCRAALASVL
jgi:hypothetical protein